MYPANIAFEWDPAKAVSNFKKHGVSFTEAMDAFYDPQVLWGLDLDPSYEEERETCLGMARRGLLVVIYTERQMGSCLRIISARFAIKKEQDYYYENQTPSE